MSEMALRDDTPVDPDDELLVAYLDGELDAAAESELMDRLLEDQELNQRLQQLQEGWEWLDKLPDVETSEKLVESTLELVVADIVKASPKPRSDWSSYRGPLGLAAVCCVCVAVAMLGVWRSRVLHYRQQLRDLELAENIDAYLHGTDLTLMRALAADPAWVRMVTASQEVGALSPTAMIDFEATPIAERDQQLSGLSFVARSQLSSRWERFTSLEPEAVEKVRRTAAAVADQNDSESLLQTMRVYAMWRESLLPVRELRDRIESNDPEVRREAISEAIAWSQERTMRRSGDQLDDETVDAIFTALLEVLDRRLRQGEESTVEFINRFDGNQHMAIAAMVGGGFGSRGSGRRPPRGVRPPIDLPRPISMDELSVIEIVLPDSAMETLNVLSESNQPHVAVTLRTFALRNWAEEATRRKWPGRERSTPLERYQRLSEEDREAIDLQPRRDFIRRLNSPFRG